MVLLAELREQPLAAITGSSMMEELGPNVLFETIEGALGEARALLAPERPLTYIG